MFVGRDVRSAIQATGLSTHAALSLPRRAAKHMDMLMAPITAMAATALASSSPWSCGWPPAPPFLAVDRLAHRLLGRAARG